MNARTRMQLLAAIAAGSTLLAAGCSDERTPSTAANPNPPQAAAPMTGTPPPQSATDKMADKMEAATDKMKAAAEDATNKAANAVDDAAITAKVKAAVLAEPGLKSLEINVDTNNGVVTLAGTVASSDLKQRAMQIAERVEGVRSVSDQLVVKAS